MMQLDPDGQAQKVAERAVATLNEPPPRTPRASDGAARAAHSPRAAAAAAGAERLMDDSSPLRAAEGERHERHAMPWRRSTRSRRVGAPRPTEKGEEVGGGGVPARRRS